MSDAFHTYLQDVCAPLGDAIRIRRMFGGHGVFCDGLMFGLLADGELYLKVNAETEPAFADAGSEPFVYDKAGTPVAMRYWRLPECAVDDPEETLRWARMAYAAAVTARRKPKPRKRT